MSSVMVSFFFMHKTAYKMRISDGISDVCSSDLLDPAGAEIDARCGDHLFGNRDDLAFGQRFGVGRESGAQSFALREVEDGKALEEGDAAGIPAAFDRKSLV